MKSHFSPLHLGEGAGGEGGNQEWRGMKDEG
jgi:hypothetical protein